MKRYLLVLMALTVQVCQAQEKLWKPWYVAPRSQSQHLDLKGIWQLTYAESPITSLEQLKNNDFFQTQIPSSVQWSLFNANKLPHPYYNKNSDQYRWVDEKVWYYTKTFQISAHKKKDYAYLCFDGLDYFSKIWVNNKLIGVHEGMFGGPSVEVDKLLNYGGENTIVVELRAGDWGNKATDFDMLPRNATGDRDFTGRKGYNPRQSGKIIKPWGISGGASAEMFFSLGMWQPVRLEFVAKTYLERPFITTKSITNNKAALHLSTEVFADTDQLLEKPHPTHNTGIRHPRDKGFPFVPVNKKMMLQLSFFQSGKLAFEKEIPIVLHEGRNWIENDFEIHDPKLWNPVGLGASTLYQVSCSLKENGEKVDEILFDYGIRTIERLPSAGPRLADNWENWQFVVNGKKIFVKGMNFTPQDVLLEAKEEKYRWTLTAARNMGVQMVRVWGGGLLETDTFYKVCDELGIMVWQDFPIGNQNTPDYPQDVWEAQVVQNIFRLRNHPSLVVWCGGNEFNPYSPGNAATIGILERNIRWFDPSRLFLRASPDGGSVHMYPDIDPSLYNVFYQKEPWVSETGMHSMPEASLLYELVDNKELKDPGRMWEGDFSDTHPEFVHHFGEYGQARVPRMLSRASHISNMASPSIETITEATQIGAAEFYQILSDKVQGNHPVTTGLMPWVFKRPWPNIAIQFMDWFGQANAPYYFLKRTYEPLHIAVDLPRLLWAPGEKIKLDIKIMNGRTTVPEKYTTVVKVYDDRFQKISNQQKEVIIGENLLDDIHFEDFAIAKDYQDRFLFIVAEVLDEKGKLVSRSFYYPRILEKMSDPVFYKSFVGEAHPWPTFENGPWLKPTINKSNTTLKLGKPAVQKIDDTHTNIKVRISNTGNIPSFMTTIDVVGAKRVFVASDNYIWLGPGESRDIDMQIWWREKVKSAKLELKSWNAKNATQPINLP